MVVLLSGAWALAAVHVEDALDTCLKAETLDLEARAALGDEVVDRYDISARIERTPDVLPWTLHLEVAESGVLVWSRDLAIVERDCPYVASLVATSVEQGLSEVPRWMLGSPSRRPPPSEAGIAVVGTLPGSLELARAKRFGGYVYGSLGLPGPLRLRGEVAIEGFAGQSQIVGDGVVQLIGLVATAGLASDVVTWRRSAVRVAARVGGGSLLAVGQQFGPLDDGVVVRPRASALFDVILAAGPTLRLGLRSERVLARVRLIDEATGATVEEPFVRVGLTVGVALPSRRQ